MPQPILATLTAALILLAAPPPCRPRCSCWPAAGGSRASCSTGTSRPDDNTSFRWPTAQGNARRRGGRKVLRPRPEEAEYERIRPTYADTAAAQWELAQWCREHRLTAIARNAPAAGHRVHPNHVEARRALGYSQIDGQWVTRDEVIPNAAIMLQGPMETAARDRIAVKQAEARDRPTGMVPEAEVLAQIARHRPRGAGPRQHSRHRRPGGGESVDAGPGR